MTCRMWTSNTNSWYIRVQWREEKLCNYLNRKQYRKSRNKEQSLPLELRQNTQGKGLPTSGAEIQMLEKVWQSSQDVNVSCWDLLEATRGMPLGMPFMGRCPAWQRSSEKLPGWALGEVTGRSLLPVHMSGIWHLEKPRLQGPGTRKAPILWELSPGEIRGLWSSPIITLMQLRALPYLTCKICADWANRNACKLLDKHC